jgi:phage gp46-like protein
MTDVAIRSAPDGSEIECIAGQLTMDDGVESAVFLSLFGGNEDDSGDQGDDVKSWWGNVGESLPERQYRSETQSLLRSIPATSSNLLRIENAITNDLKWMTDTKLATLVNAEASIPALNAVKMTITIVIQQVEFVIEFSKKWGAS